MNQFYCDYCKDILVYRDRQWVCIRCKTPLIQIKTNMQDTTVVNVKYDVDPNIVYIGRRKQTYHFGNPFTHSQGESLAMVKLPTRELAIEAYRKWLLGLEWQAIEPLRRRWILENIHTLRGKKLGCYCKPLACHGDILVELLKQTN